MENYENKISQEKSERQRKHYSLKSACTGVAGLVLGVAIGAAVENFVNSENGRDFVENVKFKAACVGYEVDTFRARKKLAKMSDNDLDLMIYEKCEIADVHNPSALVPRNHNLDLRVEYVFFNGEDQCKYAITDGKDWRGHKYQRLSFRGQRELMWNNIKEYNARAHRRK